jgi:hypothetical protein
MCRNSFQGVSFCWLGYMLDEVSTPILLKEQCLARGDRYHPWTLTNNAQLILERLNFLLCSICSSHFLNVRIEGNDNNSSSFPKA